MNNGFYLDEHTIWFQRRPNDELEYSMIVRAEPTPWHNGSVIQIDLSEHGRTWSGPDM